MTYQIPESATDEEIMAAVKKWVDGGSVYTPHGTQGTEKYIAGKTEELMTYLTELEGATSGSFITSLGTREVVESLIGDDLDDPAEIWGEGKMWSRPEQNKRGTSVEINLCLDVSDSMQTAVRGEVVEVQKNPLTLMPRMFVASLTARSIYKNLKRLEEKYGMDVKVRAYVFGVLGGTVRPYTGQVWIKYPSAGHTPFLPLLEAIRQDELVDGDAGNAKLDIVVTDGHISFNVKESDKLQRQRFSSSTQLQTHVLVIAPESEWKVYERDFNRIKKPPLTRYVHAGSGADTAKVMYRVVRDFATSLRV